MSKPTGFVIYRGPSLLNGKPIVAIATLATGNPKTGPMVQTWIMPDDGIGTPPHEHVKRGTDDAVCGDCKHRPFLGGACYVRVFQGPRSVYSAFLRKRYPMNTTGPGLAALGRGRMVRLGSYGDPAAVPAYVWLALIRDASGHTGYTHQWRKCERILQQIVMASCDTPEERKQAQAQGWRTFTVRLESDPLAPRESVCPASAEAGYKVTCSQCRMCDGAGSGKKGSIAILAHGGLAKRYREFRLPARHTCRQACRLELQPTIAPTAH